MDSVEIPTHFAAGESQTQEFKTSFDKACLASLVAFANTQGGTVWVGVTDKGVVQGVTLGKETLNEWLGQIKSAASPSLIPELTRHTIEGKTVVVALRGMCTSCPSSRLTIEGFVQQTLRDQVEADLTVREADQ